MRLVSAFYQEYYPFDNLPVITSVEWFNEPEKLTKNDVLVVWGGGDISPSLYNKPVGKRTSASATPSLRDKVEWKMMNGAKEQGIPIIGVCRGAQMLCALAGGHLIQDVNNHGGSHMVTTPNGEMFMTNTIHHQMMYPFDVKHEMLASIAKLATRYVEVDDEVEMPCEPEYVYFPEVKGFAIQWHPEGMRANSEATKYIFKTIMERL